MTPDRGRASGRGRARGNPHFQPPPEQMTSPIQQTTSARGYGRKTTKDREAIWQSIWGDDTDEEKEKEKAKEKGEEKAVEGTAGPKEVKGDGSEKLAKDLESVKITPATAPAVAPAPPAPPAVVIPPPPVISGADWSELTDDEDLAFLEDVPVPLEWQSESPENASPAEKPSDVSASRKEKPVASTVPPVNGSTDTSRRLDVATANDIADSIHEGSPKVNVRQTQQETPKDDSAAVDVKLAKPLPVNVNPEKAQTSTDIAGEDEGTFTTVGRGGRTEAPTGLQGSRWAGPPPVRGTGNQRGVSMASSVLFLANASAGTGPRNAKQPTDAVPQSTASKFPSPSAPVQSTATCRSARLSSTTEPPARNRQSQCASVARQLGTASDDSELDRLGIRQVIAASTVDDV